MKAFRGFASRLSRDRDGSALLEFAISLPLLVVFIVGIYDFSAAFNQKQKLAQAAQAGAIIGAAQPTSDIETGDGDPQSLHPVVTVIVNSLMAAGVVPQGSYTISAPAQSGLSWTYSLAFGSDTLSITINRGWAQATGNNTNTNAIGTLVTVTYPYHWRFNSAIQLLFPGTSFNVPVTISETAAVHNQI